MLDAKLIDRWPGKKIGNSFHPALWHMLDVAAVAAGLIKKYPITKNASCNQALIFLIVFHDLGKVSLSFKNQISGNAALAEYHSQLSFMHLQHHDSVIAKFIGGDEQARYTLYAAVAGHHGSPPELDDGSGRKTQRWKAAIGQQAHDDAAKIIASVGILFPNASLDSLGVNDAKKLSWQLSGLTVQADWIGSNTDWFCHKSADIPFTEYWKQAQCHAKTAIAKAGLHHAKPNSSVSILTKEKSRPMQQSAHQINLPEGPVLAIIEDATGSGKTEAALILASRMLNCEKGNGLFFALPTMATSNAMMSRLEKVAPNMFWGRPSLGLSHGRASQNKQFQRIVGNDGSDPNEPVTCGQWLAEDRRKILFADIGVGTIDQALLSVLPTRFNTLRLWALSQKILIVDEAHSYDPFMEEQLRTLLKFHAMLGGSAIVMTATLPIKMRDGYAEAFQRGLGIRYPCSIRGDDYPQLSLIHKQIETKAINAEPSTCRNIVVKRVSANEAIDSIQEGIRCGAACVWIRNSVDDAIDTVKTLQNQGISADLLHSRFTVADRVRKEKQLQQRFGRDGNGRSGKVLVATQVVEASLDLDFDLMVSDLAPIGSLIQRSGRLWRHMDVRPTRTRPVSGPVLQILSPDPEIVKDSKWLHQVLNSGAWVYPLSEQWRTANSIFRASEIRAPESLRDLIEAVHGDNQEKVPESLMLADNEDYGKKLIERQLAKNLLLTTHKFRKVNDYLSGAQKVSGEERVITRLGIPQVTLQLAKVGHSGLEPLMNSWVESEVQISRARFEKLGRISQEQREIIELKATWPEWKRSLIQIVVVDEDGSISESMRYDSKLGVLIALS